MKTIGYIVDTIEMTLRKERRGILKKSQIQTAVRVGVNNLFNKLLVQYRITGLVPTPLQPFISTVTLSLTSGATPVPENFSKEITFYIPSVNSNPAVFMNRAEFQERNNSILMPPSELDPVGIIESNYIHVRPINTTSITFTYIKKPTDVVIGTTASLDGRSASYDDASSVDTEFYVEYSPDIIKEALQFLSVPHQDPNAAQLAQTTNE